MQDLIFNRNSAETASLRGTNQSGMRVHNEKLVLSLVRSHGALAKSDIARMTGLSAQTVSVIMRALERDGLLERGEPVRGRIGQPSVPMSLAPDGAFFLGLKIGRHSADLTLIDFCGTIRATHRRTYAYPTPGTVVGFVSRAMPGVLKCLPPALHDRLTGLGVAMPYQLWNWVQELHAPQAEMDAWRGVDIQAELAAATGLPVHVQNDATSACGAELIFGTGQRPRDFLYFYFGTFIGGGLVLNGQLFLGRTGNAAGVGPMPVPGVNGTQRLFDVASLASLADRMTAAGEDPQHLWEQPDTWNISPALLAAWLDEASAGIAAASLSAATLLELEAILIDGWMPPAIRAEIVRRTGLALSGMDLAGVAVPQVREGTVGANARTLGAAAILLSQRYLLDQNTPTT